MYVICCRQKIVENTHHISILSSVEAGRIRVCDGDVWWDRRKGWVWGVVWRVTMY